LTPVAAFIARKANTLDSWSPSVAHVISRYALSADTLKVRHLSMQVLQHCPQVVNMTHCMESSLSGLRLLLLAQATLDAHSIGSEKVLNEVQCQNRVALIHSICHGRILMPQAPNDIHDDAPVRNHFVDSSKLRMNIEKTSEEVRRSPRKFRPDVVSRPEHPIDLRGGERHRAQIDGAKLAKHESHMLYSSDRPSG
jgi:hypothetical protein